jgi:hypothetical protein
MSAAMSVKHAISFIMDLTHGYTVVPTEWRVTAYWTRVCIAQQYLTMLRRGYFEVSVQVIQMGMKVKEVKCLTTHLWRRRGDRRYSSYSFTTSALDRGEWSASCPGRALPLAPIGQEAKWVPEPVWTPTLEEKSFCLCRESNLDRPVLQSVVRHYTDWATPAPGNESTPGNDCA